jgi:hypothetical protein
MNPRMTRTCAIALLALAALLLSAPACGETTPAPPVSPSPSATTGPTPTAAPTATPVPTSTPRPTVTPSPTDTPEPPLEPVTLTGTGDSVVDVGDWQCAPSLAHITGNASSRYFAVENFDAGGEQLELLVNTTDAYDGTRPLDWMDDECTTRFQVTAAGDWSITLLPITPIPEVLAHSLAVPGTYSGDGDDVILLIGGGTPDLANVSGNEAGRYFALMAWTKRRGSDSLLINTTDPSYRGTVILDETTMMLEIVATGPWTVEVTGK